MGKFSQYKIGLASLADGVHEMDFVVDGQFFKNMEINDILEADIKVHLVINKKNGAYDCSFHFEGDVEVPCDRCLDPLMLPIDTDYHLTVKYGDSYSDDSDDILVIPQSEANLNVAYMLKDTVLLAIPLRHVHPLGGCNRAMQAVLSRHGTQDPEEEAYDDEDNFEEV